ncbi:MAG: glycosyltransferase, partial [Chloroflexi bacterium]|nr:glycosyltransferase [Chloroflexota bacterium]
MSDLGIVIVNYNTRELLGACLDSIRRSDGDVTYEVVVVDNGSTDRSAELVRSAYPWVWLIASERNGGYAYANNLGLKALGFGDGEGDARAPRYALLLNPDTVLPPEALATMAAYLDAHPDVGAVGPKLVRPDGSLDKACRRSFPSPLVSLYHFSGLDRLFPGSERLARYN